MTIREFMQKYEITGGTDRGGGFRGFNPPVTDPAERYEMTDDLIGMGIDFKIETADVKGHRDYGKTLVSFVLWDEAWKGVCS